MREHNEASGFENPIFGWQSQLKIGLDICRMCANHDETK